MSYAHYTYTFSVDPSAAPSEFTTAAEVQSLLDAVWAEATASDGPELRLVHGSSRKGWALGIVPVCWVTPCPFSSSILYP